MSEEQSIAIVSFTGALKREVVRVTNKLKQCEEASALCLTIKVSGRIDGEKKIEFSVSASEYGYDAVTGQNIDACTEELLRRMGWTKVNQPLMLTANEQQRADADRVYTNKPESEEAF